MEMVFSVGGGASHPVDRAEKGKSLLSFPESFVVFDLETTGLDPRCDDIIEIGAQKVSGGEVVDTFSSLVSIGRPLDEFITELTGITDDMLAGAPPLSEALPAFLDFVGDSVVVGHNVNFDINFVYDDSMRLLRRPFSNDFVDTMRLSRRLFREERHHRLIDLQKRFGLPDGTMHRALADADLTVRCLDYMRSYVEEHGIDITESFKAERSKLQAKDIVSESDSFDPDSPIYGKSFVFTGALERMTRKEAMQAVVDRGGLCADGVSKKTSYLVLANGDYRGGSADGKSNKQRKAEQLQLAGEDVQVISESVFYDMLEE